MYQKIVVNVPHTETGNVEVDTDALPINVRQRLIELGLTQHVRSAVNSARSLEIEKAMKPVREKHEAAEAAAKKADKSHKVKKFDEAAFKEAFTVTTDAMKVAAERIAELMEGNIRLARGTGGANRVLVSGVRNAIVTKLKAAGKSHRDALAMVGDDPFAFIEKTARKRAGDDDAAFAAEMTKLNELYVDPVRALIAPTPAPAEGDEAEGEEGDADDLI